MSLGGRAVWLLWDTRQSISVTLLAQEMPVNTGTMALGLNPYSAKELL